VREELEVRIRAAQRVLNLEHTLEEKNRNLESVNQSLSAAQALIQSDLKRAATLQTGVLPVQKMLGRLCVDWFFQPAQYIGGDTFNYFPINDELLFFYSIDVSGHGISSALLSMCLQTLLSSTGELYCVDELTRTNAARFPSRLAERLNYHLNHTLDTGDHYLTLIMGVVDTVDERLYFVQAGHPQPFLYNPATQRVERIDCTGFPIGLLPDMEYETIELPFTPGSRFILYSDGILELQHASGEPMTEDDLQERLQALSALPARLLVAKLGEQLGLGKVGEEKPDDISLLTIDFCG